MGTFSTGQPTNYSQRHKSGRTKLNQKTITKKSIVENRTQLIRSLCSHTVASLDSEFSSACGFEARLAKVNRLPFDLTDGSRKIPTWLRGTYRAKPILCCRCCWSFSDLPPVSYSHTVLVTHVHYLSCAHDVVHVISRTMYQQARVQAS